jgi:hypothetical protein
MNSSTPAPAPPQARSTPSSMCPVLSCNAVNTKLLRQQCFQLVGTGPVTMISGQQCPAGSVCPFNRQDGTYGWLDEQLQSQSAFLPTGLYGASPSTSQVRYRRNMESCVSLEGIRQNLNPGRDCVSDLECLSQSCREG